jgi:hypothetical protein
VTAIPPTPDSNAAGHGDLSGPTTASRTATVSYSIHGNLPAGDAETPIISIGSEGAVGERPSFVIRY